MVSLEDGCKYGIVDPKFLQYGKTIFFLVKGLKVVAKCYLIWVSFHDDL